MSMLHTINKSPFDRDSLGSCLRVIADKNAILLMEDGVYAAMKGTRVADTVASAAAKYSVYVLGPDLNARGMNDDNIIDGISVVDYDGFVDLVTEHDSVNAWL